MRQLCRERSRDARGIAHLIAVGQRNRERPRALLGHETAPIQHQREALGDFTKQWSEFAGAGRRDETPPAAHHERVAQQDAKAREGVAHR